MARTERIALSSIRDTIPDSSLSERALLKFAGSLVSAASLLPPNSFHHTCTRCRRRPSRRPCEGLLEVMWSSESQELSWRCPSCRDEGVIVDWRGTRWDLSGEIERGNVVPLSRARAERRERQDASLVKELEVLVELIGGPAEFNAPVQRRLRLPIHASLHELHQLIERAFERHAPEAYEFLFGAPYERDAFRLAGGFGDTTDCACPCDTEVTRLAELELRDGMTFGYLFDFGEEWVHRVTVLGIADHPVREPAVIESIGTAPAQYSESEDFWSDDLVGEALDPSDPQPEYSPESKPDPGEWLALDELERMMLVLEAHLAGDQASPDHADPLHAMIHCAAETRLALGCDATLTNLRHLLARGLSRHQAIHQVGAEILRRDLARTLGNSN